MGINSTGYFITKRYLHDDELETMNAELVATHNIKIKFIRPYSWTFEVLPAEAIIINFDLGRYYGIGYERGPILEMATVLGWLLRRPIVDKVFYGGDCGDIEGLPQWDAKEEAAVIGHFFSVGHRPYHDRDPRFQGYKTDLLNLTR